MADEITLTKEQIKTFEDFLTHDGDVGENLSLPMTVQIALCKLALKGLDLDNALDEIEGVDGVDKLSLEKVKQASAATEAWLKANP